RQGRDHLDDVGRRGAPHRVRQRGRRLRRHRHFGVRKAGPVTLARDDGRWYPSAAGDDQMNATQRFAINLPADMAEEIDRKVRSGEYASVDQLIEEGTRALLEHDAAVEIWLRGEVTSGHRDYLADPSKGVSADTILDRIKTRRADDRSDRQ